MDNVKKKPLSKKAKKTIIILSSIIGVLLILLIGYKVNETYINARLLYALMPESGVAMMDDKEVEFYVEFNKDFDSKNDNVLEAYSYYYYDDEGNRVDLGPNGTVLYEGEEAPLFYAFMIDTMKTAGNVRNVLLKVVAVVAVIAVIGLLVLWFVLWSKKQDAEKAAKYGNKKTNKQKK